MLNIIIVDLITYVLVFNNKIIIQYGNVYCKTLGTGATIIRFTIAFTTSKPVIFGMPECTSSGAYTARE